MAIRKQPIKKPEFKDQNGKVQSERKDRGKFFHVRMYLRRSINGGRLRTGFLKTRAGLSVKIKKKKENQ